MVIRLISLFSVAFQSLDESISFLHDHLLRIIWVSVWWLYWITVATIISWIIIFLWADISTIKDPRSTHLLLFFIAWSLSTYANGLLLIHSLLQSWVFNNGFQFLNVILHFLILSLNLLIFSYNVIHRDMTSVFPIFENVSIL